LAGERLTNGQHIAARLKLHHRAPVEPSSCTVAHTVQFNAITTNLFQGGCVFSRPFHPSFFLSSPLPSLLFLSLSFISKLPFKSRDLGERC